MVQSIGNTVQWPLPVYNTPDIGVNDVRFKRIIHQNSISDVQIFPGFANDGDYFLVETDFATTDNYVKYYNSSMALQWTKNETDFQFSGTSASAISGITLQGSELFVLVSDATSVTTGDSYNLAKVVADGTVTNIGGGGFSDGQLGFMGASSYLSKPSGKTNFYAIGYRCALEINASNGSIVESYANLTSAQRNPSSTFITSDNRSFALAPRSNNTSAYIHFNNFNSTFGLGASDATTGITLQSNGIIRLDTVDGVPWQMTPFSVARQATQFFQFVDWGDYYILTQRSATSTSSGRTTFRGLWLKTRLDSWMKQWCDHFQIPVNNTFAS